MKLNRAHIFFFEDGDKFSSIVTDSYGFLGRLGCGITVREIEVRIGIDAFQQARLGPLDQAIPAHMRQLRRCRQCAHASRQQLEPGQIRRLFAGSVECLEAKTNSEERHASMNSVDERHSQFALIEYSDQGFEMAYTGEQKGAR